MGSVDNWPLAPQVFSPSVNKKETLNISEIAFDEVFASQLLKNLHDGLVRKWKSRLASGFIHIDSVVINLTNIVPEESIFVNELRESTIETSTASYDALLQTPFNPSQLILSKSFYFGQRIKDFYPFEIYYKSPVFDSNFNTVEGFVVNAALVLKHRWSPYKSLEFEALGRRSFGLNRNTGYLKLRYKKDSFDLQLDNGD
jgi:hypothetical protein